MGGWPQLSGVGRRGPWGQKSQKLGRADSIFTNEWRWGSVLRRGDVVEVGKCGVEQVGGHNRAGEWEWVMETKIPKTEPCGPSFC
jgi:hypothetical protein